MWLLSAGHSTQTYKGRVFCPTLKKTAFTEKTGISLGGQKTKIFSLHRTVLVSLEYFKIAFTKYKPQVCYRFL